LPYSTEFRGAAVRLAQQARRPINDLASELSVHPSTLRRWIRQANGTGTGPPSASHAGGGEPRALAVEDGSRASNAPGVGTLLMTGRALLVEQHESAPLAPIPDRARQRVRLTRSTANVAVVGILALSVLLSALITPSPAMYRAGVVVHVLSLVVGFGAVVLVDWHGLLWITGRRTLHESRRLAETAGPLIWAAIVGLLASATMLEPDLSSLLTWIKIGAVLLIVLNGVAINSLSGALANQPPGLLLRDLSTQLRRRLLASGASSQAGWWVAITIGLITDMHRS